MQVDAQARWSVERLTGQRAEQLVARGIAALSRSRLA
jgi:hypothetical protein